MIFQIVLGLGAFVIAGLIIAVAGIKWGHEDDNPRGEFGPQGVRPSFIMLAVLLFVVMVYSCSSIVQINPAERGVVVKLGVVQDAVLGEGVHYVPGFINAVEVMDVQIHAYETPAEAASRDLQDVTTTVTLNYALDPARVAYVYQNLRRDYLERIVKPAVQESVKSVTAVYDADDLIVQRPLVKAAIESNLGDRLARNGIHLEALSVTGFDFSESFNAAIEAKVTAAQSPLEAENRLRQIKVEAEQTKARAEGEKNATIQRAEGDRQAAVARAQGEAEAILLRANAQAEANQLIAASVTDPLIRWQIASTLAPGIKTVVLPAGADFILGAEVLGQ